MNYLSEFLTNILLKDFLKELTYSLLVFSFLMILFIFSTLIIKRQKEWSLSKKHRVSISVRNILIIIFLFSFLFIWSGELKTFLFSATALVGALFIVFKEILLSISGGILIGNNFNVGDTVEYDGVPGTIVDKTLLHTKIMIADVYSNKELVLPNIFFVTNKMTNTSNYGKFNVFHIEYGAKDQETCFREGNIMLDVANNVLFLYKAKYLEYFKELKQKQKADLLFEIPNLQPKVSFYFGDMKKIYFKISYIAHPNEKDEIEKQIYNGYYMKINEINSSNGSNS